MQDIKRKLKYTDNDNLFQHERNENVLQRKVIVLRRSKRPKLPLGYLDFLPQEIKFQILNYLDPAALANLAKTSKAAKDLIFRYLETTSAVIRLTEECTRNEEGTTQKAEDFGKLLRILLFNRTFETSITYFLQKADKAASHCFGEDSRFNKLHDSCHISALGMLINTFMYGKSSTDYLKAAWAFVTKVTKYGYNLDTLFTCTIVYPEVHDLKLRCLYRGALLDPCQDRHARGFWLRALLTRFSFRKRAAIIMTLYGPVIEDILWSRIEDFDEAQQLLSHESLSEVTDALKMLQSIWTIDAVIGIIKEIVKSPRLWIPNNIATLLMFCGGEIAAEYMKTLTIPGVVNGSRKGIIAYFFTNQSSIAKAFLHLMKISNTYQKELQGIDINIVVEAIFHQLPTQQLKLEFCNRLMFEAIADTNQVLLNNPVNLASALMSNKIANQVRAIYKAHHYF